MERQSEDLKKSVVDLKSRSMRDNLVFSGIPERDDKDCEEVIQNYLKTKLKLDNDIWTTAQNGEKRRGLNETEDNCG